MPLHYLISVKNPGKSDHQQSLLPLSQPSNPIRVPPVCLQQESWTYVQPQPFNHDSVLLQYFFIIFKSPPLFLARSCYMNFKFSRIICWIDPLFPLICISEVYISEVSWPCSCRDLQIFSDGFKRRVWSRNKVEGSRARLPFLSCSSMTWLDITAPH